MAKEAGGPSGPKRPASGNTSSSKRSKEDKSGPSSKRGNRDRRAVKVHRLNIADKAKNNKSNSVKPKAELINVAPLKLVVLRAKRLRSKPKKRLSRRFSLVDPSEKIQLEKWGFVLTGMLETGRCCNKYNAFYLEEMGEGLLRRKYNLWCKVVVMSNRTSMEDLKNREISMLTKLHHPNVVAFHSVLLVNKKVFLFSSGGSYGTVLSFLARYGPLFEDHGRVWFRQILNGLEYLYTNEINHNDINCESLWVGCNYNIVIGDLGRATYGKSLSCLKSKSLYSAPEVLSGEPHNPKLADMWSVGVVLYAFFMGHPPFRHYGTKNEHIGKLVRDQVQMIWQYERGVKKISQRSWEIVRSLLEPDVLKRASLRRLKDSSFYQMLECVCGYGSFKSLSVEVLGSLPHLYTTVSSKKDDKIKSKAGKNLCPSLKQFLNPQKEVSFKIEDAEKIPTVLTISDDSSSYLS